MRASPSRSSLSPWIGWWRWVPMLGAVLALGSASAEEPSAGDVDSGTTSDECENDNSCPCCGRSRSKSSVIHLDRLNHVHTAHDFRVVLDESGAGDAVCGSCGGGAVPGMLPGMPEPLHLDRIHRYRDQSFRSSLGPGVYFNYDIHIGLTLVNTQAGAPLTAIEVVDPTQAWNWRFTTEDPAVPGPGCASSFDCAQTILDLGALGRW